MTTFTISAQRHGGVTDFRNRCVPHDQVMRKCKLLESQGYINILAVTEDERRLSYDEWTLEQKHNFEVGVCTLATALILIAVLAWSCYNYAMRGGVDKTDVPCGLNVRNGAQNGGVK